MSQILKSALLCLFLGAAAMYSAGHASAAQDTECGSCEGSAQPPFLEFVPQLFPDGTACMVRHNFVVKSTRCVWDEASEELDCIPVLPGCEAFYDVICTGNGCVDSLGNPRALHGTFLLVNGTLVPIVTAACGQRIPLGYLGCGASVQVCNVVAWPTLPGPPFQLLCTTLACTSCGDN